MARGVNYTEPMHLLWINDNDKAQRAEWDKAHAAARAPLQQHWAYGSALQGFGARCLRCMVMQDDQALALAQFLVRRYAGLLEIALCTRGPVWLDTVDSPSAAPGFASCVPRGPPSPPPQAATSSAAPSAAHEALKLIIRVLRLCEAEMQNRTLVRFFDLDHITQ